MVCAEHLPRRIEAPDQLPHIGLAPAERGIDKSIFIDVHIAVFE